MSRRAHALLTSVVVLILVSAIASEHLLSQPKDNWGDKSANISNAELLDLYFWSHFHIDDNSAYTNFCPASSPSEAILSITHTVDVKGETDADVRRTTRKWAANLQKIFAVAIRSQTVRKRWQVANERSSLVIQYIRADDLAETVAVTTNGETSFDPVDFKKAQDIVAAHGGTWLK